METSRGSLPAFPVDPELLPERKIVQGPYRVAFARSAAELDEVLELRFEVFNLELGEGLESSYETGRDVDEFDPVCHHLIIVDTTSNRIVGCYRLQTSGMAASNIGFYSDNEFALSSLGREVIDNSVEVGRACVAKSHRSTKVLFLLWKGLALYVASNRKRYVFGCSSLTSQDPAAGLALMSDLEAKGFVHPQLRVEPRPGWICEASPEEIASTATPELPPLFRMYLRHGAKVCGPPALDREFKTIDYLVLFDVDAMDAKTFGRFFE